MSPFQAHHSSLVSATHLPEELFANLAFQFMAWLLSLKEI